MTSNTDTPTVLIVVGTRPEAIKLVPVVLALRKSGLWNPVVLSTSQHHEMVHEVFALAGIKPDGDLWAAGTGSPHLNSLCSNVMQRVEDFTTARFERSPADGSTAPSWPCCLLVHGDTTSALAAAMAGFHMRIPVVHIEAGLRTGISDSPFPEEMNRRIIGSIACFHFAPTTRNSQNLIREQVDSDLVYVTGNTGVDALMWAASLEVEFSSKEVREACSSDRRIVVVTAHRRENWGHGLARIGEGVRRLAELHPDTTFIAPLHPNPRVAEEFGSKVASSPNVIRTTPMGFAEFARLLSRSHLVITDSGGIQEEAPALNKPVLVTRETTERTEGVEAGTLDLVGTDPDRIEAAGDRLLTDESAYLKMASAENPYGDGHSAERVVTALRHIFNDGPAPLPHGHGFARDVVHREAGITARSVLEASILNHSLDHALTAAPTNGLSPVGRT